MTTTAPHCRPLRMRDATLGLWLGSGGRGGVCAHPAHDAAGHRHGGTPQLSPWFVTWARAALAGGLSASSTCWPPARPAGAAEPQAAAAVAGGQRHWLPAAAGLGAAPRHREPRCRHHRPAATGHRGRGGLAAAPARAAGLLAVCRAGQRSGGGLQPDARGAARARLPPGLGRRAAGGRGAGRGAGLCGGRQGHAARWAPSG
jgi:hypothetical protein